MTVLQSSVHPADAAPTTRDVTVNRIVNCGYTGRDQASVRAHVDELAAEGVDPPDTIPALFPKPNHLLATGPSIEVTGARTSGEAEFVLIDTDGTTLVGVGSDHTDRELERDDVLVSKTVCPNVVGKDFWRLADVDAHWDELRLRGQVVREGKRIEYQDGTLEEILPPADLQDFVTSHTEGDLEATALFSGSLPTVTDELIPGERFEAELYDPVLDRRLRCAYDVAVIDWVREA
jgi:hypothetical protein